MGAALFEGCNIPKGLQGDQLNFKIEGGCQKVGESNIIIAGGGEGWIAMLNISQLKPLILEVTIHLQ